MSDSAIAAEVSTPQESAGDANPDSDMASFLPGATQPET
jgi:hypothetical protein